MDQILCPSTGRGLSIQSEAAGDRTRDRAGDDLQCMPERFMWKVKCLQQSPEVQPGGSQKQDWRQTRLGCCSGRIWVPSPEMEKGASAMGKVQGEAPCEAGQGF